MDSPHAPVLEMESISFVRDGRRILDSVDLCVEPGQHWLILGSNGSGKTTLLRIAALYEHPTSGTVTVLGGTLGTTDVRSLRRRVGYLSASFAASLRPQLSAVEAVMTAKHAALEPWWHTYDDTDVDRAVSCLGRLDVAHLASRAIGSLSSGEQQRVLLARTLMNDPGVVLLDEPSSRLDLGGREQLVATLGSWTSNGAAPPLVVVSHHLEEVPTGMTHVMMLKEGRILVRGPIETELTSRSLSECFAVDLVLEHRTDGRYTARSRY